MKAKDVHRAWAPPDGTWSAWVKPVLFAALDREADELAASIEPIPPAPAWLVPELVAPLEQASPDAAEPYRERRSLHDTAIVVDLPSGDGADLALALTEHGFRPIPLYNALPSSVAIVDVEPLMSALVRGAERLADVPSAAQPAFVLDATRMGRGRSARPGLFDNRSICRPSDFPSADRFRQAGIRRIVLVCSLLQEDLEAVALQWQEAGLELWCKRPTAGQEVFPIALRRPWILRRMWRLLFRSVAAPRADGAYGKLIEEPASG